MNIHNIVYYMFLELNIQYEDSTTLICTKLNLYALKTAI
jgi:hypothetical protein